MTLEVAVEVFVRAFASVKSFAHPYVASRRDGLWVLEDGPGRKTSRNVEVVAYGESPSSVVARVRQFGIGRHFVCTVLKTAAECTAVKAAYKSLGYRALTTEWMFVHDLSNLQPYDSHPAAREVRTAAEMAAIPQLARQRRKLLPDTRQFGIWDEQRDYGWVRSVPVGEHTWVSDLYVFADVRRRGYGKALMSALLRSDKEHGSQASVLLASKAGAHLYPMLGYREIGVLQAFCPVKSS